MAKEEDLSAMLTAGKESSLSSTPVPDEVEETTTNTESTADYSRASLDDFDDDGNFVPDADPNNTDPEDGDPDGLEFSDLLSPEDSAELVVMLMDHGQREVFRFLARRKKNRVFTDNELVRLQQIDGNEVVELTESDDALLSRWGRFKAFLESLPFTESETENFNKQLQHFFASKNIRLKPEVGAVFSLAFTFGRRIEELNSL